MKKPVVIFHTRFWIAWVLAIAAITIVARNPLYTIILFSIVHVVAHWCALPDAQPGPNLARLGAAILLFTTLFNVLFVHVGENVLLSLPRSWPLVGGPITLEAAAFGVTSGLVLLALLAAFVAFNRLVTTSDLIRLMPRALRDVGVVILIAITYVPETRRQLQRIQEAQAIRGHRLRGARDWRPVIIPLLIGGLERSMTLAESMVSRGYGATADTRQPLSVQLCLVTGLLLALIGWALAFWVDWLGLLLLVGGLAIIGVVMVKLGRRFPYTHYRPQTWTRQDTLMLLATIPALVAVFMPVDVFDRASLIYVPYPALRLPHFDPLIGLSLLGFIFPALYVALNRTNYAVGHRAS